MSRWFLAGLVAVLVFITLALLATPVPPVALAPTETVPTVVIPMGIERLLSASTPAVVPTETPTVQPNLIEQYLRTHQR